MQIRARVVLDQGDPNYDSAEEPYKLVARGDALPRVDVIVAYRAPSRASRASLSPARRGGGAHPARATEQPLYQHYFVKKIVTPRWTEA